MSKCCNCKKKANVLGDDGLTPWCYECFRGSVNSPNSILLTRGEIVTKFAEKLKEKGVLTFEGGRRFILIDLKEISKIEEEMKE